MSGSPEYKPHDQGSVETSKEFKHFASGLEEVGTQAEASFSDYE